MKDVDETVFLKYPTDTYVYCSWLPIETNIRIGARRQWIEYNGSGFVWVDGTDNAMPYAIVPIETSNPDVLFDYSNTKGHDDFLDYIARVSFRTGGEIDLHPDYLTSYRGLWANALDYRPPWVPRFLPVEAFRHVELPPFPAMLNESERVAIGFFREAMSSKNIVYSLLTCLKVFEHFFPEHKLRNEYIDHGLRRAVIEYAKYNKLRGLSDLDQFLRYAALRRMDPGEYLYKGCRHAIAHAKKGERYFQASRFVDLVELYYAREIVRALTLSLILDRFGDKLVALTGGCEGEREKPGAA